jgi:hypothetical protein
MINRIIDSLKEDGCLSENKENAILALKEANKFLKVK